MANEKLSMQAKSVNLILYTFYSKKVVLSNIIKKTFYFLQWIPAHPVGRPTKRKANTHLDGGSPDKTRKIEEHLSPQLEKFMSKLNLGDSCLPMDTSKDKTR